MWAAYTQWQWRNLVMFVEGALIKKCTPPATYKKKLVSALPF